MAAVATTAVAMAAVATTAAKQVAVVPTTVAMTAVATTAVAIAAAVVVVAAPVLQLLLQLTKRLQFLPRRLPIRMLGSPNHARWSVPALFAKQEYLARAFRWVGQPGWPR